MTEVEVRAPHDQQLLGAYRPDTPAEVDAKVRRATAAMGTWARTSSVDRAEALLRVAAAAREHLDDLARSLSLEQGKTLREARMELERFVGPFEQYAGLATAASGRHVRLGGGICGHVEATPVGVVAGIVPWNFPASLFATKVAPALAAGCGFLIKPAETTTLVTQRLVALIGDQLPDGLVDVVRGGADVGGVLAGHPGVARIAFTGSTAVGKRVASAAGADLKRVSLELGGSDPFVLFADADLRPAVRALMGTRFYNAGQVCVAPKRLVVEEAVADEAIALLDERIARIRPGPGLSPDATMGPLHSEATRQRIEAQAQLAAEQGAQVVGGGRPDGAGTRDGWFVAPALVLDPPPSARIRHEETFGPLLTVIRVPDEDGAVAVADETPFGLGCSVWSGDRARAFRVAHRIRAGYTWINTLGRVYDELPFGGVKDSGIGREHGIEALESYLEPRTYVYAG